MSSSEPQTKEDLRRFMRAVDAKAVTPRVVNVLDVDEYAAHRSKAAVLLGVNESSAGKVGAHTGGAKAIERQRALENYFLDRSESELKNARPGRGDEERQCTLESYCLDPSETELNANPVLPSSQALPAFFRQQRAQQTVAQPGAYPYGGDDGIEDDNIPIEEQAEIEEVPADDNSGLVEARPVSHQEAVEDLEVAEPMSSDQATRTDRNNSSQKAHSKRSTAVLLVLPCALLGVVGLVILLVGKLSPKEDSFAGKSTSTGATTMEPYKIDYLHTLPASTVSVILNDLDGTQPQTKAYEWLQEDPDLMTYSNSRLLQRYAMATIFFAMGGPNWKHVGGETVTLHVPDKADGHKVHNPNPPPHPLNELGEPQGSGGIPGDGGSQAAERPSRGPSGGDPGASSGGTLPGERPPPGVGGPPSGAGPPPGPPPPGRPPPLRAINNTSDRWLEYGTHECNWFPGNFFLCPQDNETIQRIEFVNNDLFGTIPEEIGLLSELEGINLHRNQLQGTLPPSLGSLLKLVSLKLNSNQLSGKIPSELGLLSNTLADISFHFNRFEGSFPTSLWSLSNLWHLRMDGNQLSGSIPQEVGDLMPGMLIFLIQGNRFFGTLPPSIGNWSNLRGFGLAGNQLTGSVPTEFGLLSSLRRTFSLNDNKLQGTIPSELAMLKGPGLAIDLSLNTELSGSIPWELGMLNSTLSMLSILETSITGTVPQGLCQVQDWALTAQLSSVAVSAIAHIEC